MQKQYPVITRLTLIRELLKDTAIPEHLIIDDVVEHVDDLIRMIQNHLDEVLRRKMMNNTTAGKLKKSDQKLLTD